MNWLCSLGWGRQRRQKRNLEEIIWLGRCFSNHSSERPTKIWVRSFACTNIYFLNEWDKCTVVRWKASVFWQLQQKRFCHNLLIVLLRLTYKKHHDSVLFSSQEVVWRPPLRARSERSYRIGFHQSWLNKLPQGVVYWKPHLMKPGGKYLDSSSSVKYRVAYEFITSRELLLLTRNLIKTTWLLYYANWEPAATLGIVIDTNQD